MRTEMDAGGAPNEVTGRRRRSTGAELVASLRVAVRLIGGATIPQSCVSVVGVEVLDVAVGDEDDVSVVNGVATVGSLVSKMRRCSVGLLRSWSWLM
jgi:hypothetical protein